MTNDLKQTIKDKARQLGFFLAGVTTPEPPPHYSTFENWLAQNQHGAMRYLADERSRARRANPLEILPECKSIFVLATPYIPLSPGNSRTERRGARGEGDPLNRLLRPRRGLSRHPPGSDERTRSIYRGQVGGPIKNRWYTDTGPILERDLAQRAGLGWIGRNTCLINPKQGSYFLLAEIFLDLPSNPIPLLSPTIAAPARAASRPAPPHAFLPNRTLDAQRCISYLTIELKDEIPAELREKIGAWVFGCDLCQQACPWNRFAAEGDPAFDENRPLPAPEDLTLTPQPLTNASSGLPSNAPNAVATCVTLP